MRKRRDLEGQKQTGCREAASRADEEVLQTRLFGRNDPVPETERQAQQKKLASRREGRRGAARRRKSSLGTKSKKDFVRKRSPAQYVARGDSGKADRRGAAAAAYKTRRTSEAEPTGGERERFVKAGDSA